MSDSSSFVNLHVHTEFSLLDGAITIKDLIKKAEGFNMPYVAVTDHGNMFGAVQLFTQCKGSSVKPIIGCEVYVAPGDRRDHAPANDGQPSNYHLVLLVMNETGYKNLSRLVTMGHLEGFYYKPRVDMEILRDYNEGLIAMSACMKGIVPYHIMKGRMEIAAQKAREFESIFDDGRFYLEVQANGMPEQDDVNKKLRELSKKLSIPLVATNDCHYLNREHAEAHDALLCIQTGKLVDDTDRMRFSTNEFYFKSREEIEKTLGEGYTEALDNTVKIAERCTYQMKFGEYKYPVYHIEGDKSLNDLLKEEARKGLEKRLNQREKEDGPISDELKKEYQDRLEYELDVITKMGFSGYFLIVGDFIEYARKSGIPVGPGRGSAAGSLAVYCLGITNLDPIKYDLLFERFLNPERISMPDIDIDFCMNGRDDVIRYVTQKYGYDNVGYIVTFGTMKARGVIRDVGRVLNIPYNDVDKIAKMVPEGPKVTLASAMEEEPDLKKLENGQETERKLLRIAKALEGIARHSSTHASGIVISDKPLVEYLPVIKGQNDEIMTQFTMDQLEKVGLIKFDFLGLKTLTVIKHAVMIIKESTGADIDIDNISLTDEKTFRLCQEGKTTGVFQLESDGMKDLLRRLKPEDFEDLVALVALYRPGPMDWIPDYIDGKHGKRKPNYLHPKLQPILGKTHGVAVYQEQVMQIARDLAGFSMGEADVLRKAMGKKKAELLAEQKEKFVKGCVQNNIDAPLAEKIFAFIEPFAGYGFNRSHAACYALIGYQTAYLKAHYPVQFMAALLTNDMGSPDKTIKNIAECREMGIRILPPDVHESRADFTVVNNAIRFGLAAVKNVGMKAVESIIEARDKEGRFTDIFDFSKRVDGSKVNKRVLEGLIQCGAMDFTGVFRSRLFAAVDDVIRMSGINHNPNQLTIFGAMKGDNKGMAALFEFPELNEWNDKEKLKREKESLGFYITGHPLNEYQKTAERYATTTIAGLLKSEDRSQVKVAGVIADIKLKRTKKGDRMAVISLEDQTDSVEVVFFPDAFNSSSHLLKGDDPVLVTGVVEINENMAKIIGKEVASLETIRQQAIRVVKFNLDDKKISKQYLEELRDIFFKYPGESSVEFMLEGDNGQKFCVCANNHYRVLPCDELMCEIEERTGQKIPCTYH
ncbi:MAG: DNA polymerase III subunit alpha [Desulfatiglans sp.]|nr:DNA polymerase III subunit alpha [Desulfatiglans sp.]